jgi:hypothetical protein
MTLPGALSVAHGRAPRVMPVDELWVRPNLEDLALAALDHSGPRRDVGTIGGVRPHQSQLRAVGHPHITPHGAEIFQEF